MGKGKKTQPQIDKLCKYCEMASALNDPDTMLCHKRGIVNAGYVCRLFRYDVLKRDPGALPRLSLADVSDIQE